MSGAGIESPYSFASLPPPLDNKYGRTHVSPVYGLRGGKKRKRHEVVAAIDGESVNIYNVQSQSLVTSYALSPRRYLCHQPCSIHVRTQSRSVAQRHTYFVSKTSPSDTSRQLVCISSAVWSGNEDHDPALALPVIESVELPTGIDVAGMEVIPATSPDDSATSVMVTCKDGSIWGWERGKEKTWHMRDPEAEHLPGFEIEHVACLDLESSRRGILKHRDDVLALLDQDSSDASRPSPPLICHLVRTAANRQLRLYSSRAVDGILAQSWRSGTQHLVMSYDLPYRGEHSAQNAEYELDPSSGALLQLLNGKLTIFDLSSTLPKLMTSLGGVMAPITSFIRISASLVIAISNNIATVYETTFGSVQSSVSVQSAEHSNVTSTSSKKRKRKNDDQTEPEVRFIAAFSDLGTVLGIFGNELKILQLNDTLRRSRRRRSDGLLLGDVLRNCSFENLHNLRDRERTPDHFKRWKDNIDQLVEAADLKALEDLIGNNSPLNHIRQHKNSSDSNGRCELHSGDANGQREHRQLENESHLRDTKLYEAMYLLNKTIVPRNGHEGRLEIRVKSPKILKWLACTGCLSRKYLQKLIPGVSIQAGAIMDAVASFDDNLRVMEDLMDLPLQWDVSEVVQALKIVLQSLHSSTNSSSAPLALPEPHQENGDTDIVNGNYASLLLREPGVKHANFDYHFGSPNNSLHSSSNLISSILRQLDSISRTLITSTLRTMLSHGELLSFIVLLRFHLASGGLTSRYIDFTSNHGQEGTTNGEQVKGAYEPIDQAVEILGSLLNCAVDAIGTSGWLVGFSGQATQMQLLVESLRDEVNAGLEGCYEAATLGTFLSDIERCAASLKRSNGPAVEHRSIFDDTDDQKALLPLGATFAPLTSSTHDGGFAKKSVRVLALEKSRAVGKYSIERIRL